MVIIGHQFFDFDTRNKADNVPIVFLDVMANELFDDLCKCDKALLEEEEILLYAEEQLKRFILLVFKNHFLFGTRPYLAILNFGDLTAEAL